MDLDTYVEESDILRDFANSPAHELLKKRLAQRLQGYLGTLTMPATDIPSILNKERAGAEHRALLGFFDDLQRDIDYAFTHSNT